MKRILPVAILALALSGCVATRAGYMDAGYETALKTCEKKLDAKEQERCRSAVMQQAKDAYEASIADDLQRAADHEAREEADAIYGSGGN